MPELAEVKLRTHQAILRRKFQRQADLAANYEPVAFINDDLPSNLAGSDFTWMIVRGPEGVRYLGAQPMHLALVGMCAGWKYLEAA